MSELKDHVDSGQVTAGGAESQVEWGQLGQSRARVYPIGSAFRLSNVPTPVILIIIYI